MNNKNIKNIKNIAIKEVKQLAKDSQFMTTGVISRLTQRKDRNDNPFWDITLSDKSGDLDAKIWGGSTWWSLLDGDEVPIDPMSSDLKFLGSVVSISGKTSEFREQLQYNVSDLYYLDPSENPRENYTKRSPISDEELESRFRNLLEQVSEPLRKFLQHVFFERNLWEKFKVYPAAISIHHAYVGGLLEHSLSVANLGLEIAKHYDAFKVPVNKDLVIAGGLLHDLGKLYSYNNVPLSQMSLDGNLLGHVSLGYEKFMQFAESQNLDSRFVTAISHIIISHHGKPEFGSPVAPMMPEALIVSAADNLDFQLNYWRCQIEDLNPQFEMTDYLPLLERKFWRGFPDYNLQP